MQNRRTSRPSRSNAGNTTAAQGEKQERAPRLPNERDESADSQPAATESAKRDGKAALNDLQQGRVDTSKAPEMDAAYRKTKN